MNSNLSVDADSICMAKSMLASQSFVHSVRHPEMSRAMYVYVQLEYWLRLASRFMYRQERPLTLAQNLRKRETRTCCFAHLNNWAGLELSA